MRDGLRSACTLKGRKTSCAAGLLAWALSGFVLAQAPAGPPPSAAIAPVGRFELFQFQAQYRAAGSPRILLFWNVSFDDQTRGTDASVEVTQEVPNGEHLAPGLTTRGPAQLHATLSTPIDFAKRHPTIAARDEAKLDAAFREVLHFAGVRLLDRAASVRFTAAEKDRVEADPKLIESDAVKGKADILLEIVMVPDFSSPLGRGFKVVATQVASAEEIAQIYTLAQPPAPPRTGRYVGTDEGFKYQAPPPWIPPLDEVGQELAQEVMTVLTPVLAAASNKSVQSQH